MKSRERREVLEATVRSLACAVEESDGSVIATRSALMRVRHAQTALAKVEASLVSRVIAIDKEYGYEVER